MQEDIIHRVSIERWEALEAEGYPVARIIEEQSIDMKQDTIGFSGRIPVEVDQTIKAYQRAFKEKFPGNKRPNKEQLLHLMLYQGIEAFRMTIREIQDFDFNHPKNNI